MKRRSALPKGDRPVVCCSLNFEMIEAPLASTNPMLGQLGNWDGAIGHALLAVAVFGSAMVHQAHGQALPGTTLLDCLADQRNAEMRPRSEQPAPTATSRKRLRPVGHLWVRMSTTLWQPVLASPHPGASAIGRTQSQIAASDGWMNGHARVLFHNGKIGFMPSRKSSHATQT